MQIPFVSSVPQTKRTKQAEEFGDKGLVVQLEDIVRDETGHLEETERLFETGRCNRAQSASLAHTPNSN